MKQTALLTKLQNKRHQNMNPKQTLYYYVLLKGFCLSNSIFTCNADIPELFVI